MKKIVALAILLVLLIALSGCERLDQGRDNTSSAPVSSEPEASRPVSSEESFPQSSSQMSSEEPVSSESGESEDTPVNASPIVVDGVEFPDLSQYDTAQVTWGPGHQMNEENRPVACEGLQSTYGEEGGLFIMPAEEKKLYLTFDEGYENGYTEKILDVLKEKECPAVFFVTYDYVTRNPELVQRMVDEGHVVGNHSMHHPNMTKIDPATAAAEIAELHNYVLEHFNFPMTLFRPPEGAFSQQTLVIARELGYKTTLWSYAYADWDPDKQMNPNEAFSKVTGAAHNGAVYLLHAVSSTNTEILGSVIDTLREQGYIMERLS